MSSEDYGTAEDSAQNLRLLHRLRAAAASLHGDTYLPPKQDELFDPDSHRVWPKRYDEDHPDPNIAAQLKGVESEPYDKRPEAQGKQLALGKSGAFAPTDPALHALRQTNPHLNDYEMRLHVDPHGFHAVDAVHRPTGSTAGRLDWRGDQHAKRAGEAHKAGEINMIDVKDQHRGRGLATAMWDYAHFHATRQGSQINGPVHSETRSIEGNHWAHFVGGASMARTGGFGVQKYGA